MKISLIIVNHNTASVLRECIDSLFCFEDQSTFDVVIVDNASADDSKKVIAEIIRKHSNIEAVFLDELKSFSYANNRGIEISDDEYVLIMNPDIIFEEPVLSRLVSYMNSHPETGAISPALIGTDGNFQRNYFQRYPTIRQFLFFHSILLRFFYRSPRFIDKYLLDDKVSIHDKKLYEVKQIPCAFFLTKRIILDKLRNMDEDFILFFEDVDISYKIAKNYKLVVDTTLHVKHLGGSSFVDVEWWTYGRFLVSMILFFKKHYSSYRYHLLRFLAVWNARLVIAIEKIASMFGKQSDFRLKKFGNFLKLVKEV